MQQELEAMRKALVIRNYATKTVDTYVSVLGRFLEQLDKPIKDVTPADIEAWQFVMVNDHKISWSLFNQMVCALRFYFQKVRDCDWPVDRIPFQRRRRRLPSVLGAGRKSLGFWTWRDTIPSTTPFSPHFTARACVWRTRQASDSRHRQSRDARACSPGQRRKG